MPPEKQKTELGEWIFAKAKSRGFARKIDFIQALKMSASSVYAWADASKLAVPDRRATTALETVLRLNREEREELRELAAAQADAATRLGHGAVVSESPNTAAADPEAVATPGVLASVPSAPARWVETTPRYFNLEVAVRRAAEAGRPYPEHAIRSANILMRRDYDPAPEEWAQLLELQAAVADRFEKRERIVLEHEVAAPDPALLAPKRKR